MTLAEFVEHTHRLARRHWGMSADTGDITHSEFEYLRAIRAQEAFKTNAAEHGQHLHDIVRDMGVNKASASTMISKLEKRGLIERFQCQYDARAQHIQVSASGAELLARGKIVYDNIANEFLAQLSWGQRNQLTAAIKEISKDG
ncbi:MAG: MarR family transcriptional regulator [Cohaesibacteraceae bacterium]|nr:MarR family transcriptional regulator [Cohaesibacteraceae bacterium]MBL4875323.1 MarR family transcriptional regulator [Cohaesibacteraceae bacterium]